MKFTDEEKDEIARVTKTYWREILILIGLVSCIFLYWRWNETKKDLAESVRISTSMGITSSINAGADGVAQREKEVYPKIDGEIVNLNSSIKELNDAIKKLNKPDKGKTNENFNKQSIQDLSKWFSDNGYPNTISPSE